MTVRWSGIQMKPSKVEEQSCVVELVVWWNQATMVATWSSRVSWNGSDAD